jgi:hypothetical protein
MERARQSTRRIYLCGTAVQLAVPCDNHHAAPRLACQHTFPLQPIVIVGQSAVLLEGMSMAVSSLALIPIEDQIFIDKMIHRWLGHAGALLGILEDVQAHHPRKYLP